MIYKISQILDVFHKEEKVCSPNSKDSSMPFCVLVPYKRMNRLSFIENMRKTQYFFCEIILALKIILESKNSFDLKNN